MTVGIGIELGPTSLRAAVLERQGPTLRLASWQEQRCDSSSPEALTQALTQVRRSLHVSRPVVLGIPTTAALMATIDPLVVNRRRASLAVEFELQQHLPFDLPQAVWHYQWLPLGNGQRPSIGSADRGTGKRALGAPGFALRTPPSTKALVVAMKRERLDERLLCCQRAGFGVRAVVVHPLAAIDVWLRQAGPARRPTVFLDLSEPQAQWVVWTASGVSVQPIAALSPTTAPDEVLSEIHSSWEGVRETLGALVEGRPPGAGGGAAEPTIRLYGASATFAGLAEQVSATLQASVERLDPTRQLRLGVVRPDPPERATIAIGLALRGLGASGISLNLLADRQAAVAQARVRRASFAVGGCFGVAAIALGVSGMLSVRSRHDRLIESLTQREQTYQALRPEIRTLLKSQDRLEQRITRLAGLVEERARLVEWFSELTAALPDDVWLTKFNGSMEDQLNAVLEGRARSFQSVTRFIDGLKNQPGFLAVKPLSTEVVAGEHAGEELVAFAIHLQRTLRADEPVS